MKGKDLVKLLKKEGWELDRINGSHHIMVKGDKTLSVPCHNTDMKLGTCNALLKQAG
ncbi:MAG: type II toxin-antitoxin system HicA family toxin [Clostridiales bacterium]|jgi:predicted RNA binding protein YcfA (HicA-like mRNA interferase family)|nr:type II toxin-antitoxin system HicA family toxin [Clostridiales bacterium]